MSKHYYPAVYSKLIALRKRLAEAYAQNDPALVFALCGQIDRLQMDSWMHSSLTRRPNPSEKTDLLDLCAE
ncbi:MAG: hypothetical protein IK099_04605 [Clostridia bacterium]|nr:hypothetical protein [Clostridia bacterium]